MKERFNSVWDALEDDPVKRANYQLRTELMIGIEKAMKDKSLTQKQAAELMQTSQPRINDLLKGKFDKFSVDMLLGFAQRLGLKVSVKVAA